MSEEGKPVLHIIAGPNGAGKSTFARVYIPRVADSCPFLNADMIAARLSPSNPDRVAFEAGRQMLQAMKELSEKRSSFAIETTLSGKSYLTTFMNLRKQGYQTHLHFLWLPSEDMAVARVASRVRHGGHNIPEPVIRRRFKLGIKNFFSSYSKAVDSWILYNSSAVPQRIIAESLERNLRVVDSNLYNQIKRSIDHDRSR